MHGRIVCVVALLAMSASPAPARPQSAELADLEKAFAARVSQERLLQTVRDLVAIGARMGGTPSGALAARYHAKRFKEAGLAPTITTDPPQAAYQPLKLAATLVVGTEERALADGCLALHSPGIEETLLPLRTAIPSKDEALPNPYALLLDEKAWREALQLPRDRQPRVLLVAYSRRVESSTPVVHQPAGFRGTFLTLSQREAAWLRAQLAEAETDKAELAIEATVFDERASPLTAGADLPGTTRDGSEPPILLFCAHGDSDSGGPGADDNGSGDAVVLELATVFAELAREKAMQLPITLRFAVWGAEIQSSGAYFQRIQTDGSVARHLAVINFDQAGTGAERDCVYFEPDDLKLNEPLIRAGLGVGGDYVGKEGFWTEYTSNAALGGTDSYVFSPGWNGGGAKGDLPAITIFSAAFGSAERTRLTPGFKSPGWKGSDEIVVDYSRVYHETGDRPDVTTEAEPWNMPWVTRAAGLLALRLAHSDEAVKKLLARAP